MTAIVDPAIKTKKQLKESAQSADFARQLFTEPSPWVDRIRPYESMLVGETIVVTNHPKRSWFAQITRKSATQWSVK
jgi:hypothetical protein